jgi:MFS family permease
MAHETVVANKEPVVVGSLEMDSEPAVDPQTQPGIQNIEAVTMVWSTSALIAAYTMIWLIYFVEGLVAGTQTALSPYVTSAFAEHSLTPTISIVSYVIGGVTNFTIAKILDVFGRPQGLLCCIIVATLGLIMMASCTHVEAYAAALVFYTVGNTGLQYTLSVFVADTSSLRNRGLMAAFSTSQNMITCWIAGPIANAFLKGPGWAWAFGMFAILVPTFSLPLYGLFWFQFRKAEKQNLVPRAESKRTVWQSVLHYCREFDAIGLVLLSAGVSLFLLPFSLYLLQPKGWASPLIIGLVVGGFVLIVAFVLWEAFGAPVTFIPYSLLRDRTVLGACILSFTLFFSWSCWSSYFSSFLQVVKGLSVAEASYVIQTYTVGSVLCSLGVGAWIHYTGRFKPVSLYVGVPLSILGTGLMAYFRRADSGIGYVVLCQILLSISAGIVIICDEIAALSSVAHQHIAVILATLGLFGSVGGAVGSTVTSAIWQNVFPKALALYLPAEELPNLLLIYADISTQLSYAMGSPARVAVQRAYSDAQKDMVIAATAVWVLGLAAVFAWRDINVSTSKQLRGHVV